MFEEDFYDLLKRNEQIIQDERKFKGLLSDYFPQEKWKKNIMHFLYKMGIMEEIEQSPQISSQMILRYKSMIIDQYGTQTENAEWAVKVWYNTYGRIITEKKEKERRKYNRTSTKENEKISELKSFTISDDTRTISHDNNVSINNLEILENTDNYEITNLENKTLEIRKFIGITRSDMTIPIEINGKKVVSIGSNAYKSCRRMERLVIPEGIRKIDEGAFAECYELKEVRLPSTLVELGADSSSGIDGPFSGTDIERIDLPSGIKRIGIGSFSNCDKLKEVLLPDGVQVISEFAFFGCTSLEKVVLPASVKYIEDYAFYSCSNLKSLQLNEGLKKIGNKCFAECTKLDSLYIPSTVESIGLGAFKGDKYILEQVWKEHWEKMSI